MDNFFIFLTAAFILAITPGPAIFYVLIRSIKGGRREGYSSTFGATIGGLFHVFFAALGLSSIIAMSSIAFTIVKYAGAAYLVYLGIRMIFSNSANTTSDPNSISSSNSSSFTQGIITEILNPKTALFFLAFIPQFINKNQVVVYQFILLGCIVVGMNTIVDIFVATFSGSFSNLVQKKSRFKI